ncbi:hypothetical protein F3K36_11610 [Delftia sp. BR1]|nr:hypothetical protein F3K36_11610 [Delftia sp. BR1]
MSKSSKLKRRRILQWGICSGLSGGGLASSLVFGIGGLSAPQKAHAEIATTIAVTSAVVGMVMAHNRGDGGLSALLKASLSYLRAISVQIEELQKGIEVIIKKQNELPSILKNLLTEERKTVFRLGFVDAINQFADEKVRAAQFEGRGGFEAWRENYRTQESLRYIDEKLQQSLSLIRTSRMADPLTMILLAQTVGPIFAVKSLRGEPRFATRVQGQIFLDCYTLAQSPNVPDSIADVRNKSLARIKILTADLHKYGVELPVVSTEPKAGAWRIAGLVLEEQRQEMRSRTVRRPPNNPDILDYEETWEELIKGKRAQFLAVSSVFGGFVRVGPDEAGGGYELKQYKIAPDVKLIKQVDVKDGVGTEPKFLDVAVPFTSEPEKLKVAVQSHIFTEAVKTRAAVDFLLNGPDGVNINLTQLAICGMADEVIGNSKERLFKYFGEVR